MHKTPDINRLIHENFWIVISFAFARPIIAKIIDDKFQGEWKPLNKLVYKLAEKRADRALLEMALQLRGLDDDENIKTYFKYPCGFVIKADGTKCDLRFRDMTNKIIHAASFEWNMTNPENPIVICHPHQSQHWQRAEIDLLEIMACVGELMV